MKHSKIILILGIMILMGFTAYYFFIDTLSISQFTGDTGSARANIFVNLFDFDTGLTCYDIYHINNKSEYWNRRIKEVQSISDIRERAKANDELVVEMMQDPSLKKITRKFLGFGVKSASSLLQVLVSFKWLFRELSGKIVEMGLS